MESPHRKRFPILATIFAVYALVGVINTPFIFDHDNILELVLGFVFLALAIGSGILCFGLWRGKRWTYRALIAYFLLASPIAILFEYGMRGEINWSRLALSFVVYFFIAGLIVYHVYDETNAL